MARYSRNGASTPPATDELTEQQATVAALLVAGTPLVDISQQAGVDTSTIWRWRNKNATFKAALNQARVTTLESVTQRVINLAGLACDVLADAMKNGTPADRIDAAKVALSFVDRVLARLDDAKMETDEGEIKHDMLMNGIMFG